MSGGQAKLGGTNACGRRFMRALTWVLAATFVMAAAPDADAKRKKRKKRKKAKALKVYKAPYLDATEQMVWHEFRLLRRSPKAYADKMKSFEARYDGANIQVGEMLLQTNEGTKAVQEARRELSKLKKRKKVKLFKYMSEAARNHARYLGATGLTDHVDDKGNGPGARLDRYGDWGPRNAQILSFQFKDPADIISWLVTNDGIASRGYRRALLNNKYRVGGVGCAAHKVHQYTCVILLTGKFKPYKKPLPAVTDKRQLKVYVKE